MAKLKDQEAYSSPFLGKYLIRNRPANLLLTCFDFLLSITIGLFIKKHRAIVPPSSILLSNTAHLGDIILSTAVLPALKKAFPDCKIGIVLGSWAKPLVKDHPYIDCIHTVDHWKTSRAPLSFYKKYLLYRKSYRKALHEIKARNYSISVDLCFHFPNLAPLMWRAKIPSRIGFATAGCTPLLTHPTAWIYKDQSVVDYFLDLLNVIRPMAPFRHEMRTSLPPIKPTKKIPDIPYVVIHMSSGNPVKNWPREKWRELTTKLIQEGFSILFTGKGEKENNEIIEVTKSLKRTYNLCDNLSIEEYVAVIANAKLLIGGDTSAGHIASAVQTPAVLIYTGINPRKLWQPFSDKLKILTHPAACHPCFRPDGCPSMACVRDISVDTVLGFTNCVN